MGGEDRGSNDGGNTTVRKIVEESVRGWVRFEEGKGRGWGVKEVRG